MAGERLDATFWHRSFTSPKGRQFLAKVSSDTGIYVRSDWKIHALKIYGDGDAKEEARQLILAEVDRLALLEWTVLLKRQSIGFFIRRGFAALKEILGEDSVTLDLVSTPCKLTIRGGEEARHTLSMLINQSLKDLDIGETQEQTSNTCPICYDTVSHPVQLGCDHVYCTACIRHYLTSASDTKIFPLTCMGDDAKCRVAIPFPVIQRFLSPQKFDHLINVAFSTYVDSHAQDFRYCTTPDCVQIYRCNTGMTQKCPSCFATVCSTCHEEAHEGMTCAERKLYRDPAEQERLNENWAAENGVKKCPSCSVWIEKTEGCNHMTCKCGVHICWRCMGIFQADEIYRHLNEAHGGFVDVEEGVLERQAIEALRAQRLEHHRREVEDENLRQRRERQILERQILIRREEVRAAAERQRYLAQQQEALRRAEYQRQIDRRQEELRQAAERRRNGSWGCIVM